MFLSSYRIINIQDVLETYVTQIFLKLKTDKLHWFREIKKGYFEFVRLQKITVGYLLMEKVSYTLFKIALKI